MASLAVSKRNGFRFSCRDGGGGGGRKARSCRDSQEEVDQDEEDQNDEEVKERNTHPSILQQIVLESTETEQEQHVEAL
jgi:hypothetical protein